METILGSSNVGMRKVVMDEVIDEVSKNFHHAALTKEDDELTATANISLIMPYLYIGSWDNSVDLDLLKDKQIKFVLNVTEMEKKKTTLAEMNKRGISHDWLSIENVPDANLKHILPTAYAIIKRSLVAKKNILIHCHQGLSTSAAVVTYYIMKNFYDTARTKPMSNMLPMIINKVRSKRGYIDINFGFIEQLEDLESTLNGRDIVSGESLSIRRNKIMRDNLNKMLATNVREEQRYAAETWKVTEKRRY